MKMIQIALVISFVFLLLFYFRQSRSPLWHRALALCLFTAAFLAVLFPEHTQIFADFAGVGRGADLFLYLFSVATFYALMLLYVKLRRFERRQTEIIRHLAISMPEQKGE